LRNPKSLFILCFIMIIAQMNFNPNLTGVTP
jgi:hypothetical protein